MLDSTGVYPDWSTALPEHPLHTVVPYYTMYPLSFPMRALGRARGRVLDPFCGRGTTGFAARLLRLECVGVDLSPVATSIAAVKSITAKPSDVISLAKELVANADDEPVRVPDSVFWSLAYESRTLREICAVRRALASRPPDPAVTVLRAIMLGALHGPRNKHVQSYLSNQMPRTYATKPVPAVRYWEKHSMTPQRVPLVDVVRRRAERALTDLPPASPGIVLNADARTVDLSDYAPFDHVVTSPPYYGMRTYISDQWLRGWFLGGSECPDYAADRQFTHGTPEGFSSDLALAWTNVARFCNPGARMVVRFGAVPSVSSDPETVLRRSLELSGANWDVTCVRNAGTAAKGRRQSDQFGFVKSKPTQEIDLYATLGG